MHNGKRLSTIIEKISTIKPFLVAFAFSPWLLLLYLAISSYAKGLSENDVGIIKGFIEWFGTAYSLFLALVMVNVWDQFNTVEREFDREVDAIATLYQTANYALAVDETRQPKMDSFKKDIKGKIIEYLRYVIANYQIEHTDTSKRHEGNRILEDIGALISQLGRDRVIIESLVAELFKSLNEALDVRGDRISHSKQRMPNTIWLVAIIASIVWLLPFMALNIDIPLVQLILIGGVTFVIVIVLIIINDFNGPFEGTWKIELESWDEFLDRLAPTAEVVFVFQSRDRFMDLLSWALNGRLPKLSKCPLSCLSHKGWFKSDWGNFIKKVDGHRQTNEAAICCDQFYLTKFKSHSYSKKITVSEFPVVILRIGDDFKTLLEARQIEPCANLAQFDELFHYELAKYISWT